VTAASRSSSTRAGRGRASFDPGVHIYDESNLTYSMQGPDNRLRPPQKCLSCQTTQTPEWRRGPYGARITSLHALLVLPPFCTMFYSATPTLSRVLPFHPNSDRELYLTRRCHLLQVHARCVMHAALHTPKWSETAITGCVFKTGVHCTPRQSPTLQPSQLSSYLIIAD
jgi:hypothetical protein